MSIYYVDPLSSYPTLEQLSRLECDQWLQLGVCLGLGNDQLETIKKSQHPTAATLRAAKVKNIDLQWKDIVEALVSIGEYKLAESVCTQQARLAKDMSLVHVLVTSRFGNSVTETMPDLSRACTGKSLLLMYK